MQKLNIQPVPYGTFYTGLDNFEGDQTLVFTTDEELDRTDTEWDNSDETKLIKLAEVFQACTQLHQRFLYLIA